MADISNLFGRINTQGTVDVLDEDGHPVATMDVDGIYPVGSDLSTRHEHVDGITITREDAETIGLEIE